MAFVDTLDSLQKNLTPTIDLSNYATKTEVSTTLADYATTATVNDRLAKSVEKVSALTATDGVVTIDPNIASMFSYYCEADTTFQIEDLDEVYTDNGGTITLRIYYGENYTITWPYNIIWNGEEAPDLGKSDLVILTTLGYDSHLSGYYGDDNNHWYGNSIRIQDSPQIVVPVEPVEY